MLVDKIEFLYTCGIKAAPTDPWLSPMQQLARPQNPHGWAYGLARTNFGATPMEMRSPQLRLANAEIQLKMLNKAVAETSFPEEWKQVEGRLRISIEETRKLLTTPPDSGTQSLSESLKKLQKDVDNAHAAQRKAEDALSKKEAQLAAEKLAREAAETGEKSARAQLAAAKDQLQDFQRANQATDVAGKTQVLELQNKLNEKDKELEECKRKLAEKKPREEGKGNEALEKEIAELKKEKAEWEREQAKWLDCEKESIEIRKELKDLKTLKVQLEIAIEKVSNERDEDRKTLEELMSRNQQLKDQKAEMEHAMTELETQMKAQNTANDKLFEDLKSANATIEELRAELSKRPTQVTASLAEELFISTSLAEAQELLSNPLPSEEASPPPLLPPA